MTTAIPVLPFLRPLGLPRPATVHRFLRFSTSSRCLATANTSLKEDKNLVASRTASPSYPPPSLKSLPRPKVSRASHRTAHPTKERLWPSRRPTHEPSTLPPLIPGPVEFLPENESAPNLPYFVTRTSKGHELPVYLLAKNGGNLKQTRIRKIDGNVHALRDELQEFLGLSRKDCEVNPLNNHVILRGHYRDQVVHFLRVRRF